jgi:tetratricopeptide (TPR) repeat protein
MTQVTIERAIQIAGEHDRAGRLAQAEAVCRHVLAARPNQPDALYLSALVCAKTNRDEQAVDLIRQAIAAASDRPAYYCTLGGLLQKRGRLDDAIACCQQALALDGQFVDAHFNLGLLWKLTGRLEQSIASYQRALALNPTFAPTLNNLGVTFTAAGRMDEAMACYHRALSLQPDYPDALNNLGRALRERGQLDEAIACYRKALAGRPEFAEALSNLGNALRQQGRHAEAVACYRRAVALRPELPDPHNNLAHGLLALGELAQGWVEFEWRWKSAGFEPKRVFPRPEWTGSDQSADTVLLVHEQGYGDAIQFIRYVPLVGARCRRVLLECPADLIALFEGMPGIAELIARDQPLPEFDEYCTLLSLPRIFQTTLASIPSEVPYLKAEAGRAAAWSARLGADPRFKIGLAWAGSPIHTNDRNRSIAPAVLSPLGEIPGVVVHSLQKGAASPTQSLPTGMKIIDHTADLRDFADTAALIANLDLVISVDTAVAHLAGALAKPVWTLLPFAADWRWLIDRTDSPWYPTMRLFRQPSIGDWDSVVKQVAGALRLHLNAL